MIKVHLDTDLGGDIDDLCALALLLRRKDVQITGITTVCDNQGQRAGYARYVLDLAGRREVSVAAGAEAESGYFREFYGLPPHDAYWSEPVQALPGALDEALGLIKAASTRGRSWSGLGRLPTCACAGKSTPAV